MEKFLIIACDGVWDVLTDQDAVDLVLAEIRYSKRQYSPEEFSLRELAARCAVKIRDYAYFSGSGDNISCVVLIFPAELLAPEPASTSEMSSRKVSTRSLTAP